jgi:hypothetical protein
MGEITLYVKSMGIDHKLKVFKDALTDQMAPPEAPMHDSWLMGHSRASLFLLNCHCFEDINPLFFAVV